MTGKIVEVGDGVGVVLIPLPRKVLEELGWKDGEAVRFDIPYHAKHLIIERKEGMINGG